MYIQQMKVRCGDCFKPTMRRLAHFRMQDEYECYAENYVKCFWGLCDQKSVHDFLTKTKGEVITTQPLKQKMPYKKRAIVNDLILSVK